jgi:hypothetical protein
LRGLEGVKKVVLINLIVIVLLAGFFETMARLYDRWEIKSLPMVPGNAEGFGDFRGYSRYLGKFMNVEDDITGGNINIYEPYTAVALRPNYEFRIKNYYYHINSLGFRSKELIEPKPPEVFRVFILGGSTVEGGLNDQWAIDTYLGQDLKKYYQGVEVINSGIVGYTSKEELALLQTRILDLQPDVVVIFDGRNDLYYSIMENGSPYYSCKNVLDKLINYPTFYSLSTNLARFLTKKSAAITRTFRFCFRQKQQAVYPHKVKFKDLAIATYVSNLRLLKAALEINGIKGIIAFQPTLGYAKDNVTAYEKSVASYLQDEEKSDWLSQIPLVWPQVGRQVAAIADSGPVRTYDLTRVFEQTRETAYIDSVHYTPLGCQIIASRLSEIIRADFGGYFEKYSRQPASLPGIPR